MTSQTSTAQAPSNGAPAGESPAGPSSAYRRSVRNYLIDRDYQLKMTGAMVVIAALLTLFLGYFINRQTQEANRALAEAGKNLDEATSVFRVKAETAQALKDKGVELGPDDELALQLYDKFQAQDQVKKQQDVIKEENGRKLLWILAFFGVVLMIVLSVIGIVVTHKVAGPLYKTTLYLDRIRDGRLGQVYDLRRGDQLRDFFDHFKQMHNALRARSAEEAQVLEAVAAAGGTLGPELQAKVQDLAKRKRGELA